MNEAQYAQFEKDYDDFVSKLDAPIFVAVRRLRRWEERSK
jgi:hypothetical protein